MDTGIILRHTEMSDLLRGEVKPIFFTDIIIVCRDQGGRNG